jgi:hypothetical protein
MTVFNTEMHIVTFLITVFEGAMLFYAFIWFLSRPSDQARSRYMFLLLLLLFYNLCSGLFPDENIKIPEKIQLVMAYFGGISVSMYFVYYIYKTLELRRLKYHCIIRWSDGWGLLLHCIHSFTTFCLTIHVDRESRFK